MISGMFNNKKLNQIVTELFIRERKLNISIVFITKSSFAVLKGVTITFTYFLQWKFHILDVDFKNFKNIYKKRSAMKMDDNTRDEKLQYDTNKEEAKISALSS